MMYQQEIQGGNGKSVPPLKKDLIVYFKYYGKSENDAIIFFDYYKSKGWVNPRGTLIRNWKILAWQWIWYKKVIKTAEQ
jgi:hypothetical protein